MVFHNFFHKSSSNPGTRHAPIYFQVVVENSFGEVGLCPGNHLDPSPDFCGRALFDIERLLSYKAQTEKFTEPISLEPKSTGPKPELKFFDPLCSPGIYVIKTFCGRNLHMFVISYSVCNWQAFLAKSNVCR